jgi:low affinity Fe/Cu permease
VKVNGKNGHSKKSPAKNKRDSKHPPNLGLTIRPPGKLPKFFDRIAGFITRAVGRPIASIIAILVVLIWALSGPAFGYSEGWQLLINTLTTVVTFLMVFVIQQSQNKDALAVQLKLNELIASHERASNRLIDIEDLTSDELEVLKRFYVRLSELAEKDKDLLASHSVEEAGNIHESKSNKWKKQSSSTD